jgi:hypothetical protein
MDPEVIGNLVTREGSGRGQTLAYTVYVFLYTVYTQSPQAPNWGEEDLYGLGRVRRLFAYVFG